MGCWHNYLSEARCKWFACGHNGPPDANATPSSVASLNPDWSNLSGAGLPRLSWKIGRQMGVCLV